MPRTPRRTGSEAPGARRLNQVTAKNMKDRRLLAELSQAELAERMRALGHSWTASTVGDVETRDRNVNVDELGALALALGSLIPELLDPAGVTGTQDTALDTGAGVGDRKDELEVGQVLGSRLARSWVWGGTRFAVTATDPLSWRIAPAGLPAELEREGA